MSDINITRFISRNNHLLLTVPANIPMSKLLDMVALSQSHIGFISDRFPFLSNLNILENITLGTMFKQNILLSTAQQKLMPHVEALGLANYLEKRKESLSKKDMVRALFLRCVASGNSIILMESPLVSHVQIVIDSIAKVDASVRLWVACSENDMDTYQRFQLEVINVVEVEP